MTKRKAKAKTPLDENTLNLLKILAESAPIGKVGEPKAVIKPFPKEINDLLSSQKTKVPEVKEITLQELFNISTIAIQRKISKRMNKNRKYLSDNLAYCMETGRMFTAARLPNGKLELIDGNTRVAVYFDELIRCIENKCPPRFDIPATVTLVIHDQDSEEDSMMLYLTLDNVKASETTAEKVSGAMDLLGIEEFDKPYLNQNYTQGLRVVSKKIPGCNIEQIPNDEYGLLKEFLTELYYIDKHSNFDNDAIGGDDVAILAGILRKYRGASGAQKEVMDIANKVFSPTGDGQIVMPDGGRNAISYLRDEYYLTKPNRRFPHRSTGRVALMGFWVHYINEEKENKILRTATRKGNETLKMMGNDFLRS